MCKASWVVYILIGLNRGSNLTLYRDRKSRETKSASDHDKRIVSYPNVSRRIRSCQIGNQNRDNPALHPDHHIRTYVILSERATLS